MLLQILPGQNASEDDFTHLAQLTATVKAEELFSLPANEVLYRLYHQEDVSLYPPQEVRFRCTCSRQRCADALLTLPEQDLNDLLEEDGKIDMHCDFCGSLYRFDEKDVAAIRLGRNGTTAQIH